MDLLYWHCPKCDRSGEIEPSGQNYRDGYDVYANHCFSSPGCKQKLLTIGSDPHIVPAVPPYAVINKNAVAFQDLALGEYGQFRIGRLQLFGICGMSTGIFQGETCELWDLTQPDTSRGHGFMPIPKEKLKGQKHLAMVRARLHPEPDVLTGQSMQRIRNKQFGPVKVACSQVAFSVYNGTGKSIKISQQVTIHKFVGDERWYVASTKPMEGKSHEPGF